MLSKQEWNTNIGEPGPFADWDMDDDGIVAETEYQDGFFALIDKDDDGELTISEWNDGIDTWYGETAVVPDVSALDDDGNDVITQDKFSSEYANAGIFDDFIMETEIETWSLRREMRWASRRTTSSPG